MKLGNIYTDKGTLVIDISKAGICEISSLHVGNDNILSVTFERQVWVHSIDFLEDLFNGHTKNMERAEREAREEYFELKELPVKKNWRGKVVKTEKRKVLLKGWIRFKNNEPEQNIRTTNWRIIS